MSNFSSVLEMIGNTPLVKVNRIDTGPCELFLKLENQNPGGSIKDRIALTMISAAEREGKIRPGGTLIEATAGNTGLGLALVASQKNYRLLLIIPDKMSREKIWHLRALGADIRITRSDVGKGHPEYYQNMAERLATEIPNSYYINQFANPNNPLAHETSTGPEIWEQMQNRLDAIVCGVGSGGTLSGLGRFFRKVNPKAEMILADPEGSILADLVNHGTEKPAGSWLVEGIGEDFVPPITDLGLTRKAYTVSDQDSFAHARLLLKEEGILGGSSTGTLLAAALRYCREQTQPKRVVSFVCDSGNKYLSKMYNDFWLHDQGFLNERGTGDLRDLIARRHSDRATVTIRPDDALLTAYNRMRLYDVSQLPVLDDGRVLGLIDESDLLLALYRDHKNFQDRVASAMVTRLETIEANASVDDLPPIFARGHVAIVMDGGEFLGLITPVDLLNHLRRRLP